MKKEKIDLGGTFENSELSEDDFSLSASLPQLPIRESPSRLIQGGVCICLSGEARIEVNLTPQLLIKHRMLMLFPDQILSQISASNDFSILLLSFSPLFMSEILFRFPPTFMSFIKENYLHQMSDETFSLFIEEYFKVLKHRFEDKENLCRREIIANLLRNFFLDMYNNIKRDELLVASTTNRKHELMEQFCNLVMNDFKISREVSYYANKMFITPKYLSMILKELDLSHRSAKEWIDDYTVTEIKMHLKATSCTLQDIANELHFPSLSFVCKYFKNRTGMTPKEYRKQFK